MCIEVVQCLTKDLYRICHWMCINADDVAVVRKLANNPEKWVQKIQCSKFIKTFEIMLHSRSSLPIFIDTG